MPTWIALIRGINVGGKNVLPMKELERDFRSLQLEDLETYIQSGNVVFRSSGRDAKTLEDCIADRIEQRHGFRPRVLVLTAERFDAAVRANPFPEATSDPKTLHLFFLAAPPATPDLGSLNASRSPGERFHLAGDVFYLHAPDGIGRSKLAAGVDKHLGVQSTARNWRTVQKIREIVRKFAVSD